MSARFSLSSIGTAVVLVLLLAAGPATARQPAPATPAPQVETLKPAVAPGPSPAELERRKAAALQQRALETAQAQTRALSTLALVASVLLAVETVLLVAGGVWFWRARKKTKARTLALVVEGTAQAETLSRLEGRLDQMAATLAQHPPAPDVDGLGADGPGASGDAWWREARAGLIEDILAMLSTPAPAPTAGQAPPVRPVAEPSPPDGEPAAVAAFLKAFEAPHEPFGRALQVAAGSGFLGRLEGAERLAATLFIASESLTVHGDPGAHRAAFDALLADLGLPGHRAVIGEVGARAAVDPAAFYYAESPISDTIARTLWPGIRRPDGVVILKSHVRVH